MILTTLNMTSCSSVISCVLIKDSDNFGRSQQFLIIYFPEDKCLHVRCGHGNLLQKQTQMQEKAECEVRTLESRVEEIVERGTWQ